MSFGNFHLVVQQLNDVSDEESSSSDDDNKEIQFCGNCEFSHRCQKEFQEIYMFNQNINKHEHVEGIRSRLREKNVSNKKETETPPELNPAINPIAQVPIDDVVKFIENDAERKKKNKAKSKHKNAKKEAERKYDEKIRQLTDFNNDLVECEQSIKQVQNQIKQIHTGKGRNKPEKLSLAQRRSKDLTRRKSYLVKEAKRVLDAVKDIKPAQDLTNDIVHNHPELNAIVRMLLPQQQKEEPEPEQKEEEKDDDQEQEEDEQTEVDVEEEAEMGEIEEKSKPVEAKAEESKQKKPEREKKARAKPEKSVIKSEPATLAPQASTSNSFTQPTVQLTPLVFQHPEPSYTQPTQTMLSSTTPPAFVHLQPPPGLSSRVLPSENSHKDNVRPVFLNFVTSQSSKQMPPPQITQPIKCQQQVPPGFASFTGNTTPEPVKSRGSPIWNPYTEAYSDVLVMSEKLGLCVVKDPVRWALPPYIEQAPIADTKFTEEIQRNQDSPLILFSNALVPKQLLTTVSFIFLVGMTTFKSLSLSLSIYRKNL